MVHVIPFPIPYRIRDYNNTVMQVKHHDYIDIPSSNLLFCGYEVIVMKPMV